jgi:hypothetical protein
MNKSLFISLFLSVIVILILIYYDIFGIERPTVELRIKLPALWFFLALFILLNYLIYKV